MNINRYLIYLNLFLLKITLLYFNKFIKSKKINDISSNQIIKIYTKKKRIKIYLKKKKRQIKNIIYENAIFIIIKNPYLIKKKKKKRKKNPKN